MTKRKALKKLVRARAAKTGESYAAARRQPLTTKEDAVTTAEPTTNPITCARCGAGPTSESPVFARGRRLCSVCHERIRTTILDHVGPKASERGVPADYAVPMLHFSSEDGHWVVHVHSVTPGLLIGVQGTTAAAIRQSLIELFEDHSLRLNIVAHDFTSTGCTGGKPKTDPEEVATAR